MLIQLQRVRKDGVVTYYENLETTMHRVYDDKRRELEAMKRDDERVRCVADDSPEFQRLFVPEWEDLQ